MTRKSRKKRSVKRRSTQKARKIRTRKQRGGAPPPRPPSLLHWRGDRPLLGPLYMYNLALSEWLTQEIDLGRPDGSPTFVSAFNDRVRELRARMAQIERRANAADVALRARMAQIETRARARMAQIETLVRLGIRARADGANREPRGDGERRGGDAPASRARPAVRPRSAAVRPRSGPGRPHSAGEFRAGPAPSSPRRRGNSCGARAPP